MRDADIFKLTKALVLRGCKILEDEMRDDIYEENGRWHYDEQLYPESRGWVTHSFDTKEQAEACRDERENTGLAKMAGGEVERVDGLREAYEDGRNSELYDCVLGKEYPTVKFATLEKLLEAARIQLKRQEG